MRVESLETPTLIAMMWILGFQNYCTYVTWNCCRHQRIFPRLGNKNPERQPTHQTRPTGPLTKGGLWSRCLLTIYRNDKFRFLSIDWAPIPSEGMYWLRRARKSDYLCRMQESASSYSKSGTLSVELLNDLEGMTYLYLVLLGDGMSRVNHHLMIEATVEEDYGKCMQESELFFLQIRPKLRMCGLTKAMTNFYWVGWSEVESISDSSEYLDHKLSRPNLKPPFVS
eukprot:scaffold23796_cov181-Cylindrotheca_fusiformis.AAC.2